MGVPDLRPYLRHCIVIYCTLSAVCGAAPADDALRYSYIEQTGKRELSHSWTIRQIGSEIETHWISPHKAYLNLCDETGDTVRWRVRYPNGVVTAERVGNTIRIKDTRNRDSVQREVRIDKAPWFQPLSYALGRFSRSHRDSVVFWTIRPDNLKVVKLRATNLGKEEARTQTGLVPARKVSITLDGFLSHFWEAHYWFRQSDGLFLRYEGVNGLPGTPRTTIELAEAPPGIVR